MDTLGVLRGPLIGADCGNCPFARDGKPHNPVLGVGPADPKWLAIGEGPGQQEARTGLPFVGPTGQLLDRALRETGCQRTEIWLGNATLCLPTKSDEKTKQAAAVACKGRLDNELAQFPGKPVLALGGVATKSIVGHLTGLPITEIAGAHFELAGDPIRDVFPTVHPAAILRSSHESDKGPEKTGSHVADLAFWALKWDILKTNALATGRDVRLPMRVDHEIHVELENPIRARQLVMTRLVVAREQGRITIDYETGVDDPQRNFALQAFIARIRLLGLANAGQACSVKWDLLDPPTIAAYAAVLADPAIIKGFHNLAYDTAVSRNQHYSLTVEGPLEDTMLGQHAAWPGAKKKLQHVACQYRAIEPWKSEYRDSGDTLAEEAVYNAKDALATDETIAPTHFWVKRNQAEKVYAIDRIKARFAADMHLAGYYVDPDVNDEIKRRLRGVIDEANAVMHAKYEELQDRVHARLAAERAKTRRKADPADYPARIEVRLAEITKLVAKGKFEFKAANDWHAVALLKACGIPMWKTTPTGRTASGGDVLEGLASHPEVDELIRIRANEQLLETFVERMFEWKWDPSKRRWKAPHVQDDGRVHPIWSGTQISGRFGSKDPASSNWSMGDETNKDPRRRLPNIRRQLGAPPGRAIVAFDKCLAQGTLVQTATGDRPIEALRINDIVLSHNRTIPTYARVSGHKFTGYRATMVIGLDNGGLVRCTPDHRWLTDRFEYIYARDLTVDTPLLSTTIACKVSEIIDDGLVVPTWDIEVADHHVFALTAGAIVSNSQLEARLIAVQSGDPFLCSIFRDGKDIHHEFGVIVFPRMTTLDKSSEEYNRCRDVTKRFEYGAIYQGSDATVHAAISADDPTLSGKNGLKMVSAAIIKMKSAIPGVFAWQARLLRETSQPPYTLRSYLLGRRRVFPLGNPPPTDIANNPNQFAGADIMDEGLARLLPRLDKYQGEVAGWTGHRVTTSTVWPLAHQHDAIYFECNEDDAEALAKDVDEAFYTEVAAVNGEIIAFPNEIKIGFAYHTEPSDKQKLLHPQTVWSVGRPGLKKHKVVK